MKDVTRHLLMCAAALALAGPATAETITLDFTNQPTRPCGSAWTMSGLEITMLPLSLGCIAYDTQYGWVLGATCLEIDVSMLTGLRSVSASFLNYDASHGYAIYLLDDVMPVAGGGTTATLVPDTLVVQAGQGEVKRVRVFCYNCIFYSFTVDFDAVAVDALSWGQVKALFR